ncbi:MAG: HU family DNA-binding protein, partial [bacterium]|nr:HU family DNA-binding protein [bacterium]
MSVNRTDLVAAIAEKSGLNKTQADSALKAFEEVLVSSLSNGEAVKITGLLSVERVERAARTGRNPRTGEAVPIEATVSPRFRPGAYFKDAVTDPTKLPKDGLAGARVGSDGTAPAPSGAPASVRRSAQPASAAKPAARKKTAAKKAAGSRSRGSSVSGTPETVRATKPAAAAAQAPKAPAAPAAPMSGSEEITQKLLSAKKAQLARVKNDAVAEEKAAK